MMCPSCGQPMTEHFPVAVLDAVPMPPQARVIVSELARAFPRHVSIEGLVDALYAGDPNGGPDDPQGIIRTRVCQIRKAIVGYGWTIPRNTAGPGARSRYRLEKITGKTG